MNRHVSVETRIGSRTTGAPPNASTNQWMHSNWTLEKSKALELLSSQETPYVDSGICRWDQGDVFLIDGESFNPGVLLMEEILHQLGSIKPWKSWKKLPINWCRISSINSYTGYSKLTQFSAILENKFGYDSHFF